MADGSVTILSKLDTTGVSQGVSGIKSELKGITWNDLTSGSAKAQALGSAMTSTGKAMTTGFTLPIVAAGAAAFAAFNEVDEGADNVIRATGATGEAAQELESVYKSVATQVVGSFDEIGSAVGEVNTRFGVTGDELDTMSTDFIKFTEITGVDTVNAVQSVSRYMAAAGMETSEYKGLLDKLSSTAQASGISMDKLMSSLDQNGAAFRGLGYDTDETIAMLGQFELAGVNVDQAATGITKAFATWTKEGKDAKTEFASLLKRLQESPDDIEASTQAFEIFGTRSGTDLVEAMKSGRFSFEEMLGVVKDSEGTLDDTFDGCIDGGYDAELAMQNAKVAFAEVGTVLQEGLAPILQTVSGALSGFAKWFSDLSPEMKTAIITIAGIVAAIGPFLMITGSVISNFHKAKEAVDLLGKGFLKMGDLIMRHPVIAIAGVIAIIILALMDLYNTNEEFREGVDSVLSFVSELWGNFMGFIEEVVTGIQGFLEDPFAPLRAAGEGILLWFNENFPALSDFIGGTIQNAQTFFEDPFGALMNQAQNAISFVDSIFPGFERTVGNVITGAQTFFQDPFGSLQRATSTAVGFIDQNFPGVTDTVSGVISTVQGFFQDPFAPLRNAINDIINWWSNNFRFPEIQWPRISLPHFYISPAGWQLGDLLQGQIPSVGINWYAKGGVFNGPSVIGLGEAGPEAVIPLSGPNMAPFADEIAKNLSSDTSETIQVSVTIENFNNLDTQKDVREVSRIIASEAKLRMKALGI